MLLLQSHHIVDLYVCVDNALTTESGKRGRPALLSESELVTLLVWNTLTVRSKTLKDIWRWIVLYHRGDIRNLPRYSAFVAQCHRVIPPAFVLLEALLCTTATKRIMDATMLPVCKPHRADEHKTAKTIAAFGKNWQGWHFGFKLHASIDLRGALCAVVLTSANVYDAQAMHKLVNEHCRVAVGDTLYGASVMRKKVWNAYGTMIISPPFPKQNKKIAAPWQNVLLDTRSKIESVFDILKEHLHLVSSFPRSVFGYVVHYVRILLSYQIMALSLVG